MNYLFQNLAHKLIEKAKQTPYTHLPNYMNRSWLLPYSKFRPSARIHHILRSDNDRALHDHPWPYVTVILRGGYFEIKPVYDRSGIYVGNSRKWYGPGSILFRRSCSWHRLELPEGKTAWTLFITGRYTRKWGFMPNPATKVEHTTYLNEPESPYLIEGDVNEQPAVSKGA
jgi:hypothetical protein